MQYFAGRDGLSLAYREVGSGRPLILLHGFTGEGRQWVEAGHAARFAERGHRVILPDLRGHGAGVRPHDPAGYPPDVLADDGLALVEALGPADYDLAGYSLGARVVLRMLVRGARPRRAVIAGQGMDATAPATDRTGGYRRVLAAMADGGPLDGADARMAGWLTTAGADPRALLLVLDAMVGTSAGELAGIDVPTLVLIGQDDTRAAADELAAAMPGGRFATVPGGHDAFTRPELAEAILDFVDG